MTVIAMLAGSGQMQYSAGNDRSLSMLQRGQLAWAGLGMAVSVWE